MFINEVYSDNNYLQGNQIKSKQVFNDYCNEINQDLERLEKLEKAIEILKNKLGLYFNEYINYSTINAILPIANNDCNRLTQQEYELLKEALENA